MSEQPTPDTDTDSQASGDGATPEVSREVVRSIVGYASREGAGSQAVLQASGASGVRVTLVGADGGILGDRVVPDMADAAATVADVPDVETAEWNRELNAKTTVTPKHWRKMAGWVAHQKRFPKARNADII